MAEEATLNRLRHQMNYVFDVLDEVGGLALPGRTWVQRFLREAGFVPPSGRVASNPQIEMVHVGASALGAMLYNCVPGARLAETVREFWNLEAYGPVTRYFWNGAGPHELPRRGKTGTNASLGDALLAVFESSIHPDPALRAEFRQQFERITIYPEFARADISYQERTEVIAVPSVRQPPSGNLISTSAITAPLVIALAEVALESRELAKLLGTPIETATAFAALGAKPFPTISSLLRKQKAVDNKEKVASTANADDPIRSPKRPAAKQAVLPMDGDKLGSSRPNCQERGGSSTHQETTHALARPPG
jgi:hypothetical protein